MNIRWCFAFNNLICTELQDDLSRVNERIRSCRFARNFQFLRDLIINARNVKIKFYKFDNKSMLIEVLIICYSRKRHVLLTILLKDKKTVTGALSRLWQQPQWYRSCEKAKVVWPKLWYDAFMALITQIVDNFFLTFMLSIYDKLLIATPPGREFVSETYGWSGSVCKS